MDKKMDNKKPEEAWRNIRTPEVVRKICEEFDISINAVYLWKIVPADRLEGIEKATGIQKHLIRPDLYSNYSRNKCELEEA